MDKKPKDKMGKRANYMPKPFYVFSWLNYKEYKKHLSQIHGVDIAVQAIVASGLETSQLCEVWGSMVDVMNQSPEFTKKRKAGLTYELIETHLEEIKEDLLEDEEKNKITMSLLRSLSLIHLTNEFFFYAPIYGDKSLSYYTSGNWRPNNESVMELVTPLLLSNGLDRVKHTDPSRWKYLTTLKDEIARLGVLSNSGRTQSTKANKKRHEYSPEIEGKVKQYVSNQYALLKQLFPTVRATSPINFTDLAIHIFWKELSPTERYSLAAYQKIKDGNKTASDDELKSIIEKEFPSNKFRPYKTLSEKASIAFKEVSAQAK